MNREYYWRASVSDLVNKIECANPPGDDPHKQLAALHVFKYEILAAFNRLYLNVPAETADGMIQEFLRQVNAIVPSKD
jgi:hypothetical protein